LKKGKTFEKLVAQLEKSLSGSKSITFKAPEKLRDKVTGQLREHDIILYYENKHHSFKIAIECRDRSRPIGVNQIESFFSKCNDTQIDQGIMVSAKGFYNTAIKKAKSYGIGCFNLEQVSSLDWMKINKMKVYTRNIIHSEWSLNTENLLEKDIKEYNFIHKGGTLISNDILISNIQRKLQALPIETSSGKYEVQFQFNSNNLFFQDKSNNEFIPINNIIADITYETLCEYVPFNLFKYSDKQKDQNITDLAITEFKLGKSNIKIMITQDENKGGKILIIPEKITSNTYSTRLLEKGDKTIDR
jgi:hypothetical protein